MQHQEGLADPKPNAEQHPWLPGSGDGSDRTRRPGNRLSKGNAFARA
jgi:hypothetical protein